MFDPAVIGPREPRDLPRPLLRTTLGEVLRRTRLEQRRTLADVARAAKVSMPYLSEVERGRKEASSEVLAAICDALRIDLADLLAEAGSDLLGDRDRALRPVGPERVLRLGLAGGQVVAPPPGPGSAPQARAAATCLLAA